MGLFNHKTFWSPGSCLPARVSIYHSQSDVAFKGLTYLVYNNVYYSGENGHILRKTIPETKVRKDKQLHSY